MVVAKKADVFRVLRFLCLLALFLSPWPGLGETVSDAFSEGLNAIVDHMGLEEGRTLRFEPAQPGSLPASKPNPSWHTIGSVRAKHTQGAIRFAINLRAIAYIPWSVFLALSLAVPIWKRPHGPFAFLLGGAIVSAFIFTSVMLAAFSFLSNESVSAVRLGPVSRAVVESMFNALVVPPGMSYAAPALIWLLAVWVAPALRNSPEAAPESRAQEAPNVGAVAISGAGKRASED